MTLALVSPPLSVARDQRKLIALQALALSARNLLVVSHRPSESPQAPI